MKNLDSALSNLGLLGNEKWEIVSDEAFYEKFKKISKKKYQGDILHSRIRNLEYNLQESRYDVIANWAQSEAEGFEKFKGKFKLGVGKCDDFLFSGKGNKKGKTKFAYDRVEEITKILERMDSYVERMSVFSNYFLESYHAGINSKQEAMEKNAEGSASLLKLRKLRRAVRRGKNLLEKEREEHKDHILPLAEKNDLEYIERKLERYRMAEAKISLEINAMQSKISPHKVQIQSARNQMQISLKGINNLKSEIAKISELKAKLLNARNGYENYILSRKTIWG